MANKCAVILAAGEGKRMKSNSPKVLSEVLFKPMLGWVIDSVKSAGIDNICVVAGFKHDEVESYLNKNKAFCKTALQLERKGTGHAVKMAESFLNEFKGSDVLILNGDAPFISAEIIKDSYDKHKSENNSATVISAKLDNPFGYGRIVRNSENGKVKAIIEQKDASSDIQKISEVNSGAYWFSVSDLLSVLNNLSNENAQGEYYLPDTLKLLLNNGKSINAFTASSPNVVLGANDCIQLFELNKIANQNIIRSFMQEGIKFSSTDGIIIGPDVTIKKGSRILPGTIISGKVNIGENCIIGPNSQLIDSNIGNNVQLNCVYCINSNIGDNEKVKPFSSLQNI